MRIISVKRLRDFWGGHPQAEQPLKAWYHEINHGDWASPTDIKARYRSASFVGDNRVVFNIGGNKYRLVVKINYPAQIAFIRFVGTHREYDRIDVETI